MSSSGLGGGKKVRMKRRRRSFFIYKNGIGLDSSLNGVDLRVVYISPFLSQSLSKLSLCIATIIAQYRRREIIILFF